MDNYDDFDLWGLEDELASGELAYKYGDTNYGNIAPGQQPWSFDPEQWNFNSLNTGQSMGATAPLDFTQETIPEYNYTAVEIPEYQPPQIQAPQPQAFVPSVGAPALDLYDYALGAGGDFSAQQQQWQELPMPQGNVADFRNILGSENAYQEPTVRQFDNAGNGGDGSGGSFLDTMLEGINKVGSGFNSILDKNSGLLPLLFMGSGLASSRAAGQTAETIGQIAEQEQAKEDENQRLLQEFLQSGFMPTSPDASQYQTGNTVDWTPTDVLARYRTALDDPRYGLQEYMDAEGGQRAEAAARRSAKGGRTGLGALTQLMAMRDYLGNGRKTNLQGLYQEAGIAANQDQARLQAAVQQANANMQANSQRYTTDSQRWTSQLNNMYQAANSNNGAAAAIAAAQASGSQNNPFLSALAQYMGGR